MMKAVITGHTRGLGAYLTADMLSRGVSVLGIARTKNSELQMQYGAALNQVELDLSSLEEATQWIAGDTLARFLSDSHLVLLVNNAATVHPLGIANSHDTSLISRAVSLNVAVPLILAGAVMGCTAAASDRRILHLSSGAGRSTCPGLSIYGATKAALDHHARMVAQDNLTNLRICSLAPGVVDTNMQAEVRGRQKISSHCGKCSSPCNAVVNLQTRAYAPPASLTTCWMTHSGSVRQPTYK